MTTPWAIATPQRQAALWASSLPGPILGVSGDVLGRASVSGAMATFRGWEPVHIWPHTRFYEYSRGYYSDYVTADLVVDANPSGTFLNKITNTSPYAYYPLDEFQMSWAPASSNAPSYQIRRTIDVLPPYVWYWAEYKMWVTESRIAMDVVSPYGFNDEQSLTWRPLVPSEANRDGARSLRFGLYSHGGFGNDWFNQEIRTYVEDHNTYIESKSGSTWAWTQVLEKTYQDFDWTEAWDSSSSTWLAPAMTRRPHYPEIINFFGYHHSDRDDGNGKNYARMVLYREPGKANLQLKLSGHEVGANPNYPDWSDWAYYDGSVADPDTGENIEALNTGIPWTDVLDGQAHLWMITMWSNPMEVVGRKPNGNPIMGTTGGRLKIYIDNVLRYTAPFAPYFSGGEGSVYPYWAGPIDALIVWQRELNAADRLKVKNAWGPNQHAGPVHMEATSLGRARNLRGTLGEHHWMHAEPVGATSMSGTLKVDLSPPEPAIGRTLVTGHLENMIRIDNAVQGTASVTGRMGLPGLRAVSTGVAAVNTRPTVLVARSQVWYGNVAVMGEMSWTFMGNVAKSTSVRVPMTQRSRAQEFDHIEALHRIYV